MLAAGSKNLSHRQLIKLIDTETKQLRAIEDLYLVLQAQSGSGKLKDRWTMSTPPIQVLTWILKRLGRLARGNEWTVDTYTDDRGRMRYRFAVWRGYHAQKVKQREEFLPLDFLPALLLRDKPAHDMIISAVALVSRCNKVPLWDEDEDYAQALRELLEYPAGTYTIDRQKETYTSGIAAVYLRLIKRVRRSITIEKLEEQLKAYDATSQRKRYLVWIIKNAIPAAAIRDHIGRYHYVPHYLAGNPIGPNRLYKLVWSQHANDLVNDWAMNKLRLDEQSGFWSPVEFSIAEPGQVLKPLGEQNPFPEKLSYFMDQAVKHFLWGSWKEYYYKEKTLTDSRTPAEQMLEQIELSELKKRVFI